MKDPYVISVLHYRAWMLDNFLPKEEETEDDNDLVLQEDCGNFMNGKFEQEVNFKENDIRDKLYLE